MNELTFKTE